MKKYSELVKYVSYFEKKIDKKVPWIFSTTDLEDVITLGYPRYDTVLISFIEEVENSEIMVRDYITHLGDFSEKISDVNNAIENADELKLRAILTYFIRQERFCDGLWGDALEYGYFLNILKKLMI